MVINNNCCIRVLAHLDVQDEEINMASFGFVQDCRHWYAVYNLHIFHGTPVN
jgi:hypothetical protein